MRQIGALKTMSILVAVIALVSALVVIPVYASGPDEDQKLTGLTISPGTLSPTFSSDTYSYTVSGITADNDTLTVTGTAPSTVSIGYWAGKVRRYSWGTTRVLVKKVDDPDTDAFEAYLAEG